MNCIGPCAPATLVSRIRPKSDSTKFTAASSCHGTPERRCASAYQPRNRVRAAARPGRNAESGRGGVRRASSRCAKTSSPTSRASRDGNRRRTRTASAGSSARRSSTFCNAYADATVTGAASARTICAASLGAGGGGVGIRELQVRDDGLQILALVLGQHTDERLQRLDREPRLLEVARLLRELPVRERREQGRAVHDELLHPRLPQLLDQLFSLRFAQSRLPRSVP